MAHPSATSRPVDPLGWHTLLTANDSTQQEGTLGCIRTELDQTYGQCKYMYVKNNSGTDLAAGVACLFTGPGYDGKVSRGIAANVGMPAGVAFGAITASYYGWIQVGGYNDHIHCDTAGGIARGNQFVYQASRAAGEVALISNGGKTRPYGYAVANDTTTSVEGFLTLVP